MRDDYSLSAIKYGTTDRFIISVDESELRSFWEEMSAFANLQRNYLRMASLRSIDTNRERVITKFKLCSDVTLVEGINATSSSEFHVSISEARFGQDGSGKKLKRFLLQKYGMIGTVNLKRNTEVQ
jgi:hypothetical protein